LKVFDPTPVGWYQLRERTKNSEKSDVSRLPMASVAVTKRAHLTAQLGTVENQCVVSGHSKTWFMSSTPRTAVALQLPNHQRLFPTAHTFGLMLGGDYGTDGHVRDSVCKSIAGLRRG
jgi:hypothetical protein